MKSKYITFSARRKLKRWNAKLEKENITEYDVIDVISEIDLPYEYIGSGKHRVVFDIGNGHILKVPRTLKGIRCNHQEIELFQSAPPELKNHLCKIKDYGPGWLVMKKMNKGIKQNEQTKAEVYRIYNDFCLSGMRISDIVNKKSGNPKRNNLRRSKKHGIVIIDYANTYPWNGHPPLLKM